MHITDKGYATRFDKIILDLRRDTYMRIIRNGEKDSVKKAVALGNFDGIHIAHTAVIKNCRKYAEENAMESSVFLFRNHTLNCIENRKVNLITDESEKLEILSELGVDSVYITDFDENIRKMTPEEFVKMLIDTLNPCAVFAGYDYRFGYKAEGDINTLIELGKEYGFDVVVTDEMKIKGEPVKSTKIRQLIADGEIYEANKYLGRPFSVTGKVVSGFQNGRTIGIPTANVEYSKCKLLPKNGVYMGYTTVRGKSFKSVINVGANPTIAAKKITVESHILDFNADIYGKTIKVEFIERIRDEITFKNLSELKEQIKKDIEIAENEFSHREDK